MQLSTALEGYKIASLAEGYSPHTLTTYISALGKLIEYLGEKEIDLITSDDLHRFMSYLTTDYTPERLNNPQNKTRLSTASHHRYWKAIRFFFKWAGVELSIKRPDLTLKMPAWESKEIVPFTEDEIKSLLKNCESANVPAGKRIAYQFRRSQSIRNKAIILTLLDTGVRVGELTRLRICDVNLENGEVYIHRYHVRKTHSRTTYLDKVARKILWRYIVDREGVRNDDFLFVTVSNKPMTGQRILNLLSQLGKNAGIMRVHPHRFRHTFAIQYLRNGGDIFTLKRILGHKSFEMVNHYLNLSSADASNAHQKASPVDRWNL